jgi:murein DD-endopeptidase MepM/ murein hydrolase activator NlpD
MLARVASITMVMLVGLSYLGYRQLHTATITATAAQQARTAPIAAQATNDRERFAIDLLGALGNTQPTSDIVSFVVEWTLAEDSGSGAMERFNPLNTTICGHNWTGAINGDGACGVGGYATYEDGIAATVDTLTQSNFIAIATALQMNDATDARQALFAAPWAESHYGYGVGWPAYHVAEPNTMVNCPVDPCWQSGTGYSADHPGIDLGATSGQPVYAVIDGTIANSVTWPCGNGVMVTQGEIQTLVCHLSAFAAADGQAVRTGDVIGYAGSTGDSTGAHVHFEIRQGGINIDPSGVMQSR